MNKDSVRIALFGLVVVVAGFVLAYQFVEPSPPSTITIASGSERGAYYQFANRYKEILERQGIKLNVVKTQGSVENIQLLEAGKVDVAFVQGGVGDPVAQPDLVSLGSLYFEPLWVFVRADSAVTRLSDLTAKNMAVGSKGSGTWPVVRQLLALNDLATTGDHLHHVSSADGAESLVAGTVDAAFFITSPKSSLIRELLANASLRVLAFERSEAYVRQMPSLSAVTFPAGVVSLSQNIPAKDVTLLAPAATLATHAELHPALQNLLVQALIEVHGTGGVFEDAGQFPSTRFVDYPLSADAKRYLNDGPPLLQRYLPFWAAVMIDRLKVMLVPLLTLLIPLFKILPPAYRWRVRSSIYSWYKALSDIELRAASASTDQERQALRDELAALEVDVRTLKVPLSYSDELYNLRLHMDLIQKRLS